MIPNAKLTVAVHVLVLMAKYPEQTMTSEYIAGSVNTNPVVIRRVLGVLRQAGIVRSQGGVGGGWALVTAPDKLTLLTLRRAVQGDEVFDLHPKQPNPKCPVGRNIQAVLQTVYGRAEAAMDAELARTTIAALVAEIVQATSS